MKDEPNIQVKPAHRDGVYFDDEQRPVPVVWPSPPERSPEDALLVALAELGAVIPNREKATEAIATMLDKHGDTRAAELLVMLVQSLPGGRRGDELRAALLGNVDGESVRETAKRHGIAHVTLHKSVKRLREHVRRKTANTCRTSRERKK